MEKPDSDVTGQPLVDNILRSLSDRPNVQSTLILARKDGSIIRSTGFPSTGQGVGRVGASYQWTEVATSKETTTTDANLPEAGVIAAEPGTGPDAASPSPTEVLAAAVFQFVNNAALMGTALVSTTRPVSQNGSMFGRDTTDKWGQKQISGRVDSEHEMAEDEHDVQLLRLRTKQQEIIIFPDPQYLCCVVQTIGKLAGPADTR